ncbi:MAG: CoA-binding protein [Bacteroidetes bacterium]|jgi:predicted CoA-binding protein|nr:CoA-binding protein [Bacteroidota bacterium]
MVTKKQIEEFIAAEPIAMAGVSRNPRKFGFTAFRELKEKGMNIIPVNPYAKEIHGAQVFNDLKSLPPGVKGLLVMTRKNETLNLIREAKGLGLKQIWIQQNSESREALEELRNSDINYITGQCILMHYKPHSIHKFHRSINKFFGKLPK